MGAVKGSSRLAAAASAGALERTACGPLAVVRSTVLGAAAWFRADVALVAADEWANHAELHS